MDNISATDRLLFCNFGMYLRDNECVSRMGRKKKEREREREREKRRRKKPFNIGFFLEAS